MFFKIYENFKLNIKKICLHPLNVYLKVLLISVKVLLKASSLVDGVQIILI